MKTYENEKHFLRRDIGTIFLLMGNECNLNCRYCLQHPLVTHPICHDINPDIYDFIEQVCHENIGLPLDIRFWGGEPLVFYPTIKAVITELTDKRGLPVKYSFSTNGKLLDEEMVQYFIDKDVFVALSWDGPNVEKTRGYDAIKEKKELLFKLPKLCISAVMSSQSYPKEVCESYKILDDEYYEIWGHHINFNIDDIYDTGGIPEDLLQMDLDRVSKEIYEMTLHYLQIKSTNNNKLKNSDQYPSDVYIERLVNSCYRFYSDRPGCANAEYNNVWCGCGNGYNTINLGLDGKLYPCHNTSHSTGDIFMDYFKYLRNVIAEDNSFKYRDVCNDCIAISYCRGGCKLMDKNLREKYYCNLKKAVISPVLELLTELGTNLLKQEDDNDGSTNT